MYSSILSFTVLPNTRQWIRDIIQMELIPLLRNQPGLIELSVLRSSEKPSQFLVIASWESMEAARGSRRLYARIRELLQAHMVSMQMDGEQAARFYAVEGRYHRMPGDGIQPEFRREPARPGIAS